MVYMLLVSIIIPFFSKIKNLDLNRDNILVILGPVGSWYWFFMPGLPSIGPSEGRIPVVDILSQNKIDRIENHKIWRRYIKKKIMVLKVTLRGECMWYSVLGLGEPQ